jgi:hypothetical protein
VPIRETKSAEEIRVEVHRLIHEGAEVRADGATIRVPVPTPFAAGVTNEEGANWDMNYFGNPAGYEGWIRHVVKSVQARWDLKT